MPAVIPPIWTGIDLISAALRLIGVLAETEVASGAQASNALRILNDLIDAWGGQRLTIYVTQANTYPLISGQQSYTIGPGGDFNQAWPTWIPYAGFVSQVTPFELETPLSVWTVQQWAGIPTKTGITTTIPQGIYYDRAFPLGNISFWPIFQGSIGYVRLYCPTALTGFADQTTAYSFPPGYARAIRYNLAVELAAEYGRPLDPNILIIAGKGLKTLKQDNFKPDFLVCDGGTLPDDSGTWSTYNIYNDTMGRNP